MGVRGSIYAARGRRFNSRTTRVVICHRSTTPGALHHRRRELGGQPRPRNRRRIFTGDCRETDTGRRSGNACIPGLAGEPLEDAIFGDLLAHSSSRNVAESISRSNQPVYRFYLSYLAADRRARQPGVAHTDDIAFVMQTLDTEADLKTITDRDREVSQLISAYWVQFAKTGDPNRGRSPRMAGFST